MSQLQCPACGAEMSLDVVLSHEALRRATFELLQMSLPLGALVMRYVALFRPAKNRMGADRMAKLVAQLLPDMQRQVITHRGRDWDMPLEGWRAGFEAMLEKAAAGKLTLPLDTHAYLYTVLVGLADKLEAGQEESTEQQRRNRGGDGPNVGLVSAADLVQKAEPRKLGVPDHIKAQLADIRQRTVLGGAA